MKKQSGYPDKVLELMVIGIDLSLPFTVKYCYFCSSCTARYRLAYTRGQTTI